MRHLTEILTLLWLGYMACIGVAETLLDIFTALALRWGVVVDAMTASMLLILFSVLGGFFVLWVMKDIREFRGRKRIEYEELAAALQSAYEQRQADVARKSC